MLKTPIDYLREELKEIEAVAESLRATVASSMRPPSYQWILTLAGSYDRMAVKYKEAIELLEGLK